MKKKFSVTATVTVTGWVEIQAEDLEGAEAIAARMIEEGIDINSLQDPDLDSEVLDIIPTGCGHERNSLQDPDLDSEVIDIIPSLAWTRALAEMYSDEDIRTPERGSGMFKKA